MRKQIPGVLFALLLYIPASAQIGQVAAGNQILQTSNGTANPMADFSTQFRLNSGATYTNSGTIYWLNKNTAETFIVNGTYTSGASATDYFQGSISQQNMEIAGTSSPVFNNLVFRNGQMNVSNLTGITINKSLTLENGITITQRGSALNNSIRINNPNAAGIAGVFSNTRHVDGYVSRTMSAAGNYLFPVGDEGSYRPVTYTPVAASSYVSLAYLKGAAPQGITSFSSGIVAVSPAGSWQVSGAVNGTAAVSIPDMSTFAVAADLRLVGWNGTEWVILGSTASGNTEGSTLSGNISTGSSITAIGVGSVSTPLPVTLGKFEAKFEANIVHLNWETYSEKNNLYFQVLRSSNSKDWVSIGQVNGTGTTSEKSRYKFADDAPFTGVSYYRLRQFDVDGTSMLSSIRSVVNPNETVKRLNVYPNPNSGRFTIDLPESDKVEKISLFDLVGQRMPVSVKKNGAKYELVAQNLIPGMYILYILQVEEAGGKVKAQKIIVQP